MEEKEKKMRCSETNIELPEAAQEVLDTMIRNLVQDFLKQKEWKERSEGTNN